MREALRRVWYLLNRSRFDRELLEDMAAHREMKGDAGPRFGNTLRLREEARDEWGWTWIDRLAQDARFALRLLARAPAFTATATAVLAFGVGLNLAAFQVFETVALSWLPVRSPQTLVRAIRRTPTGSSTALSHPAFDFYRQRSKSVTPIGLMDGELTLGDDGGHRVPASFVTSNYFTELGIAPLAGRLLDVRDDAADAGAVIAVSEGLWRRQFGADPLLVGRTIRVNGRPFTVAGIVPSTFVGLDDHGAAWVPMAQHPLAFEGSALLRDWRSSPVRMFARLSDGVSRPAAEAELKVLVDAVRQANPASSEKGEWLSLRPAGRFVALEEMNPAAAALVTSLISLVLVTACMNLGLLLLARSISREREFAIRLSVGATRGRIVRQLVTEHLMIAGLGAAAGCAVSAAATRLLLVTLDVPSGLTPHFTPRVVVVALGLAVLSSLLFGFTPAVQALKPAPGRLRFRNALVAVQVGAACVLLIVSALLVRSVTRITRVPLGFEYETALTIDPSLGSFSMSAAAAGDYWRQMEERVGAVAGVESAALVDLPPLGDRVNVNRAGTISYRVSPSYFETMRIPIVRGRVFSAGEPGVAIVSEALARQSWPGQDPLGQVQNGATIVGVSADARTIRLRDPSASEFYRPIGPAQLTGAVMIVRLREHPDAAMAAISASARSVDSRVLPSVVLLRDRFEAKLETPRQVAVVTSALGICALLLAVTGLAGLISFTVSQRTREIGVRMALGARAADIVRAVARQFAVPVGAGFAVGALCAAGVAAVLKRELFGLSILDPLSYGAAALAFALVSAAATMPSVRRALRIDPITALRHE